MRNYIIILLSFICFSCDQMTFKEQIPLILGTDSVTIEKSQRIDVSGGLRKSYLLEVYKLSPTSVYDFLKRKEELPIKEEYGPWYKYGWHNFFLKEDSLYSQISPIILNSDWGSNDLGKKLLDIRTAINNKSIYWGLYCKPNMTEMEYVQMYILDTLSNTLYIMDSNM